VAVVDQGAGKSASLNSLIGHPVLVLPISLLLLFFYFLFNLYLFAHFSVGNSSQLVKMVPPGLPLALN